MRTTTILAACFTVLALAFAAPSAVAADRPSIVDDLAARLGISADRLRDAFKATLTARIDAAVAAGRLTPEQGARLKERIANTKRLGFQLRPALVGKRLGFANRVAATAKGFGAAADYLGLTRAELRAELRDGRSLAQIATARGKKVDGLVAAIVAPAKERLAKAVAAKRLTQERADALLDRLTDRVERLVQRTFAPER
jgi:hypothetical protein